MDTVGAYALRIWSCRVLVLVLFGHGLRAADWPQWRGPQRDGRSTETGLMAEWPRSGPPLLWTVEGIGVGYSSVAVAGRGVYVTGMVGAEGCLWALDREGHLRWVTRYGPEWKRSWAGPRGTPTVADGRVYLLSTLGLLAAYDEETGTPAWQVDLQKEYQADVLSTHGICESLLLVDDKVICCPGGPQTAVAAFARADGKLLWRTTGLEGEKLSYSSPLLLEQGTQRVVAVILSGSLVGIDPADGRVLWRHVYDEKKSGWPCAIPVVADDILYAPVGKDMTGKAFRVDQDGREAVPLWEQPEMRAHHGGVIASGGCLYGTPNEGGLTCLDLRTGQVRWQAPREPYLASLAWAEDRL